MNRHVVDNDLLAACGRLHNAMTAFWAVALFAGIGALWYVALCLRCGAF